MYSKQVLAILKVFDHGDREGEREGETRAIPKGARAPINHRLLFVSQTESN